MDNDILADLDRLRQTAESEHDAGLAEIVQRAHRRITDLQDFARDAKAEIRRKTAALMRIEKEDWGYTCELPHAPDGTNRKAQGPYGKIAAEALLLCEDDWTPVFETGG